MNSYHLYKLGPQCLPVNTKLLILTISVQVSHVTAVTAELEKSYGAGGQGSVGQIKQLLGSVVEKLNILKRKVQN